MKLVSVKEIRKRIEKSVHGFFNVKTAVVRLRVKSAK